MSVFFEQDSHGNVLTRMWVTFAAFLAVGALVLTVLTVVFTYTLGRTICERTAEALELEHHWGFWEGCIVEHDGVRVHIDELRRVR